MFVPLQGDCAIVHVSQGGATLCPGLGCHGLSGNAVKYFVLGNCWYSCIMRASISEKSIYVGRFLRNRHFEMLHSVAFQAG